MAAGTRPRLAVSWNSGCGGCEAAFLDLGDRLLALEVDFELVYFPLLIDRRRQDLERLGVGAIDVTMLTGAIRTTEDVRLAQLLRRASKTLVAFGACAQTGSVLALADLVPVEVLLRTVRGEAFASERRKPSAGSVDGDTMCPVPELTASVQAIQALVPVDCSVPGCPPELDRLREVLDVLAGVTNGRHELPARGSVLGGSCSTVCEDCSRQRPQGGVNRFRRLHEVDADPSGCLLDQGLVCSGPATRGGCGAPCPAAGAPCRGCYGFPPAIEDQGARMLGALAAIIDVGPPSIDPGRLRRHVEEVLASVVDPVGTLYRYCYAQSLLAGLHEPEGPAT